MAPERGVVCSGELLSMEHLCTIMDAASAAKKRGAYKKQVA